jgi:hypothetical protein
MTPADLDSLSSLGLGFLVIAFFGGILALAVLGVMMRRRRLQDLKRAGRI